MKKKIFLFFIIASIFFNLTGCTLKNKHFEPLNDMKKLTNTERAYIDIWKEFRTLDNEYVAEGNAAQISLNDDSYDDFSKLCLMKSIYFDEDGTFKQYSYQNQDKFCYSGDFQINQSGEVSLDYQRYDEKYIDLNTGEEKEIFLDIKNENTNLEEGGRIFITLLEDMKSANDKKFALEISYLFSQIDKHSFMPIPHIYDNSLESNNWNMKCIGSDLSTKLYIKGDFFVIEQKGYSFDGDINEKEFNLKYDDTEFADDNYTGFIATVKFHKDGSWESDYQSGYSGTWELYHDNLLVIHPPTNTEVDYHNCSNLLYLNFDNKEIFVPAFIRCDEIINAVKGVQALS